MYCRRRFFFHLLYPSINTAKNNDYVHLCHVYTAVTRPPVAERPDTLDGAPAAITEPVCVRCIKWRFIKLVWYPADE